MSEWAAPVLFVRKKIEKLQFWVDCRTLNNMSINNAYSLSRMDEWFDTIGDAKHFAILDVYYGYWKMKIRKKLWSKTAIICNAWTSQCVKIPFGLTKAAACFQRALNIIIMKFNWKIFLVCLDDVTIFSNNECHHIKHVHEILKILEIAIVTLIISATFNKKWNIQDKWSNPGVRK